MILLCKDTYSTILPSLDLELAMGIVGGRILCTIIFSEMMLVCMSVLVI